MNKSMIQLCALITTMFILVVNGIGGLLGVGDIIHTTTEPDYTIRTVKKTTTTQPSAVTFSESETDSSSAGSTTTTSKKNTTEGTASVAFAVSQVNFGGEGIDNFKGACGTQNGGYVAVGTTTSESGDLSDVYDGYAVPYSFINKYDESGTLIWTRAVGASDASVTLCDIAVLSDGSIITVGYTASSTYSVNGSMCALMVKYTSDGALVWSKVEGGSGFDMFNCVAATSDGFVCGGKTSSNDGGFADLSGASAIVIYYDCNGTRTHLISYSSSKGGSVNGIDCDSSGNVFAAVITNSTAGDFADFEGLSGGYSDSVVIKFDATKNLEWYYVVASSGRDNFERVAADGEGGCAIAGYYEMINTSSPDGTLSGITNCGGIDGLIIKLNSSGKKSWTKTIAGYDVDCITDIVKIRGGYAVSAYTYSSNRDFINGNLGGSDSYVFVISPSGATVSTSSHAGSYDDSISCLAASVGTGFAAFGQSISSDNGFDGLYIESLGDQGKFFKGFYSIYRVII